MSVKGKLKHRKLRKSHKSVSSNKKSIRHCTTTIRRRTTKRMSGGNYETDITTRTTDGIPTKPLNRFVVTVPGYGTMSAVSYKKLMESIDRDGPDAFIK